MLRSRAMDQPTRRSGGSAALSVAAAIAVFVLYAWNVGRLLRYPWDWSPDEGFPLDLARRLWQAPQTLFPHHLVPAPADYGPVLPALLAPVVKWAPAPLAAARCLAAAWTAAIAAAVFALVRTRGGRLLALAVAALALAPMRATAWYALVRVDGPMTALWLWSAVLLLPRSLSRNEAVLSWPRALGGGCLVAAAVLTKPVSAALAFPVVLGWVAVDRRSAVRALVGTAVPCATALGLLEALTRGGFSWTMSLWATHPTVPGQILFLLLSFVRITGLVWLALALTLLAAVRRGSTVLRDGSWLMVLGGLSLVPAMAKYGAWWHYLLPLLCAATVLLGRSLARLSVPPDRLAPLPAVLGLVIALSSAFPLPSPADDATARTLYAFAASRGAPLLALLPEYAYFVVGQPVEVEGSSFAPLVAARVPGVETVEQRVSAGAYTTIITPPQFWPVTAGFERALVSRYRPLARCRLGYIFGQLQVVVLGRREHPPEFQVLPGSRCEAFEAARE